MTGKRTTLFFLLAFFLLPWQVVAAEKPPVPAIWTLRTALHFALANNPDSRIALQRISVARAGIKQMEAAFYPQLAISTGYSRTDNPIYSFGNILNQGQFNNSIDFNNPGLTDDLNLTTTLQYRIYNGGRDQAGLKAARAGEEASRMQRSGILSHLGYEVVRAFFTIVQTEETRQARLSAIEAVDASLNVAKARFEAGDLLKTDLLNLEVQKSRARENLIRARHALNLAKHGFLNLLGLEQGDMAINLDEQYEQPVPKDLTYDRRPEIAQLDAMIKAAEARVRQAKSGYYPTADAFGSYQVDKGYQYDEGSGDSWTAGIKINYNLFDGNMTSAAVSRAKAELAEAKERKHKLELAISLEIEQGRLGLQQAEERLLVTKKMVELALENARLSRERFKQGVLLSSDLIDVENRLTDARVRHSLALASRRIAVADLRRAVGLDQLEDVEITAR